MNRFWKSLICGGLVVVVLPALVAQSDRDPQLTADEFKAGLLFKILPYVEWPRRKAEPGLTIGMLGQGPINGLMKGLAEGETVRGQPIRVLEFPRVDSLKESDLAQCQVLFIPPAEVEAWKQWSKGMDLRGVLTVGASPPGEFLKEAQGILNLVVETKRLEIHRRHARGARIRISSKLSRIAKVY